MYATSTLENPRWELFAQHLASGKPVSRAYVDAGFSKSGACQNAVRLLTSNDDVRRRVNQLAQAHAATIFATSVRHKMKRIEELDWLYLLMVQVVEQRAEDPTLELVPGGTTGIIVLQKKKLGEEIFEEYQVDTGLLKEMRENRKQVAQELGEWMEQLVVTPVENEQARMLAEVFTVDELEDFKARVKKLREREAAGALGTKANPVELAASKEPVTQVTEEPIPVTQEEIEYPGKDYEAPKADEPAGSGWDDGEDE